MNTPIYDGMKDPENRPYSDETPNVKIENPDNRRKLTTALGVVGAVLGAVIVADMASPAFDLSAWTDPIAAVFLFLGSYYGIGVTLPNTPKGRK